MNTIKTLMDALKTGRPFTDEERKETYNLLKHINESNTIEISTKDGTIKAYKNDVSDYPTINVTWQLENGLPFIMKHRKHILKNTQKVGTKMITKSQYKPLCVTIMR